MREQLYLIMATVINIEFPHSKILEKMLNFYDLNTNSNLEHLFKAVYIIFKTLLKEIKKNKPNFSHFLQDCFNQKAFVFKYFMDLSFEKIREFSSLVENSNDVQIIDTIYLYMNENLLKFSLKMLSLEVSMPQMLGAFDAGKHISNMEFLQKLGNIFFHFTKKLKYLNI